MTARPEGMVGPEHFTWEEEPLGEPGPGEYLVKNLYLSFDPTMRVWMNERDSYLPAIQIGEVMRCGGVGQILASQHPDFEAGDLVTGGTGWQDYCLTDGSGALGFNKLPAGTDPKLALSVLGMTGLTGYFGMIDVGKVKEGDTVLVSGAAGATGSIAAQVARLRGARVVGIAGGEEKCAWLKDEARLDGVIDYKSENLMAGLKTHCPKGIDVFFDNVGGPTLDAALAFLRQNARVALCGAISGYNAGETAGIKNYGNLIVRRAIMQGFLIFDFAPRYGEAVSALSQWIAAGEIAFRVDVQEGLENAPTTFQRIFTGANQGKQLLRLADPE